MFIYKISNVSVSPITDTDAATDTAADTAAGTATNTDAADAATATSTDTADTATSASPVYIGSTTETLKRRLSRHHYKAKIYGNRKLYAAMNQSGGDWKIEMLKDCGIVSKAELLQEELRFINEYDSIRRGLNTLRPIR